MPHFLQILYANSFTVMDNEDPFTHLGKIWLIRYNNLYSFGQDAIIVFSQVVVESLCETWDRYKAIFGKCFNHVFEDTAQIHIMNYNNIKPFLDATVRGSLLQRM